MINQNFNFPKIFSYFSILLLLSFLLLTSFFYYQNSLTLHFVDEEHNIVLGSYLLKGEKLYSDMFNNHQPFAHILSSGIQKLTNPNSIYLLIKRHREFMILWTVVWSLILLKRYSTKIIPFVIVYELTKILLLGNLFLSESLIVYPLIYLVGILFEEKISKLEYIFLGLIFGFITFTLAPVWPVLAVILITLAIKKLHFSLKKYFLILIGAIPILVLVLFYSSVVDYFFDVFYINSKYFIPYGIENGTDGISLLAFITPLLSFFSPNKSASLIIINIFSFLLVFYLIILIKQKKYWISILIVTILGLANLRYIQPGQEIYRGFHLLPWYALLIFFVSYFSTTLFKDKSKNVKILITLVLIFILIQSTLIAKNNLFQPVDVPENLYINYSQQFDNGILVKTMKTDQETMLVSPDEWLVYWQADINHPKKIVNFYEWMVRSPELRKKVDDLFINDPPTYVYCNCPYDSYLMQYLGGYSQIVKHGNKTSLYVLKTKLKSLNSDQLDKLKYYGVEINKL